MVVKITLVTFFIFVVFHATNGQYFYKGLKALGSRQVVRRFELVTFMSKPKALYVWPIEPANPQDNPMRDRIVGEIEQAALDEKRLIAL